MTNRIKLQVTGLGAKGDGIADGPDGPVFVPYALPGETVLADVSGERAHLLEVLKPAADRAPAVCRHFANCGGCAAQHMAPQSYSSWKRQLIVSALAKKSIEADVAEPYCVGTKARRRAVFTATARHQTQQRPDGTRSATPKDKGLAVDLGFTRDGTHEIVDLHECPVLADEIVAIVPRLRELVEPAVHHTRTIRIHVLRASNGLDVDLTGLPKNLPRALKAHLTANAANLGAIRVTMDQDPIFTSQPPTMRFGPAGVIPPPGVFLQASTAAEERMVAIIMQALPKRTKRFADLFCGLGAFSFPVATRASVTAFDQDSRAIKAMNTAIRAAKGLKPIKSMVRDLFQEPLSRKELEDFDAVVFDPPRAGAKAQAKNLAASTVKTVIAISCNPATFARDARTLIDGGYMLQNVTPVDQFVYAAHVETVAVFQR